MERTDNDPLMEKVRGVLEDLTVEERQLLNAVMRVESEHLHKAQPQVTQELVDAVMRYIK